MEGRVCSGDGQWGRRLGAAGRRSAGVTGGDTGGGHPWLQGQLRVPSGCMRRGAGSGAAQVGLRLSPQWVLPRGCGVRGAYMKGCEGREVTVAAGSWRAGGRAGSNAALLPSCLPGAARSRGRTSAPARDPSGLRGSDLPASRGGITGESPGCHRAARHGTAGRVRGRGGCGRAGLG